MRFTHLFVLSALIGACIPAPIPEPTPTADLPMMLLVEENPYRSQPEDVNLRQAGALITSASLSERFDLDQFRVELRILGSLPRACNELRIEAAMPNDQYQIFVEVYSLVDTTVKCENVFQQFDASILLGVYSLGRYTVWVNGGLIGDFITYQ